MHVDPNSLCVVYHIAQMLEYSRQLQDGSATTTQLAAQLEQHKQDMTMLRTQHKLELDQLRAQHDAVKHELTQAHQAEVEQLSKVTRARFMLYLTQLHCIIKSGVDHSRAQQAENRLQVQLSDLTQTHQQELSKQRERLDQRVTRLTQEHEAAMRSVHDNQC